MASQTPQQQYFQRSLGTLHQTTAENISALLSAAGNATLLEQMHKTVLPPVEPSGIQQQRQATFHSFIAEPEAGERKKSSFNSAVDSTSPDSEWALSAASSHRCSPVPDDSSARSTTSTSPKDTDPFTPFTTPYGSPEGVVFGDIVDSPASTPSTPRIRAKRFSRRSRKSTHKSQEELCSPLKAVVDPGNRHSSLSIALEDAGLASLPEQDKQSAAEQAMHYFLKHPEALQTPLEAISTNIIPNIKGPLARSFPRLTAHLGLPAHTGESFQLQQTINSLLQPERMSRGTPREAQKKFGTQFLKLQPDIVSLLNHSWYEQPEYLTLDYQSYNSRIRESLKAVKAIIPFLAKNEPGRCLKQDMEQIIERLEILLEVSAANEKSDFRSQREWSQAVSLLQLAAKNTTKDVKIKEKIAREVDKKLAQAFSEAVQETPGRDFIYRLDKAEKNLTKALLSLGDVKERNFAHLQGLLESGPAEIEEYSWHCQHHDRFVPVMTRHTPAKALRFHHPDCTSGAREPFARAYEKNRYLSSVRDEQHHAINLIVSDLFIKGEKVSTEIRCGIPHAFAIADEIRRSQASLKRWCEIITAAVINSHHDQLLDQIRETQGYGHDRIFENFILNPKQLLQELPQVKPVEVELTYFNLLSPDSTIAKGGAISSRIADRLDPEKNWCDALTREITELNSNEYLLLGIYDSNGTCYPVLVKPTVRMFCTPCNKLALPKLQNLFDTTIPNAREMNTPYLEQLFGSTAPDADITGRVADWLQRHPEADPVIIHELRVRTNLVRYMHTHQLHRRLWSDIYPMLMNLIVIEEILGTSRLITCKSGKDRTGNISRMTMAYIAQTRLQRDQQQASKELPFGPTLLPVDRIITPRDLFNASQSILNTGQLAIQARNTCKFGFKMDEEMLGPACPLAAECLLGAGEPGKQVDWHQAHTFLKRQFTLLSSKSQSQPTSIPESKSKFYTSPEASLELRPAEQ